MSFQSFFRKAATHSNAQVRTSYDAFPAPYVKVYLMKGKSCLAKAKTKSARKTLDPLYQSQITFEEDPSGKLIQVRNNKWALILTGSGLQNPGKIL